MITISQAVEEEIKNSPFLEEALYQNLINLSALARKIRPELEKRLYKNLTDASVMMALKRLSHRLEQKQATITPQLKALGDVTVRSSLVEYTFANSSNLVDRQHDLLKQVLGQTNLFLTFSQGIFETTIFASASLSGQIEKIFEKEQLKLKLSNLSSITIILPKEVLYQPGIYYNVLKVLAWEGINFIEVVSSYTELTIFLDKESVDRAFSVLKRF